MSEGTEKAFTGAGVAGHLARMVVFVLIGYFLSRPRSTTTPTRRSALDGALAAVANASYGPVLLGIVAAG